MNGTVVNGYLRRVMNQVFDNFGQPYAGVATVGDQIESGTPNELGITGTSLTPASYQTNSSGQWTDDYSTCSSACYASTGRTDATQLWTYNGVQLAGTTLLIYKCTSIEINGQ